MERENVRLDRRGHKTGEVRILRSLNGMQKEHVIMSVYSLVPTQFCWNSVCTFVGIPCAEKSSLSKVGRAPALHLEQVCFGIRIVKWYFEIHTAYTYANTPARPPNLGPEHAAARIRSPAAAPRRVVTPAPRALSREDQKIANTLHTIKYGVYPTEAALGNDDSDKDAESDGNSAKADSQSTCRSVRVLKCILRLRSMHWAVCRVCSWRVLICMCLWKE
jgi:hypothetical protein